MHPSPQAFVIAAMDPSPSNGVSTKCKGPVSGCRSLQASAQSPTKLRSPSGPWQNWTNSSSAVLKYRLLPGSNPSQPGARRCSSTICFAAGVINPSATRAPVMCPWRPHAPARVGGMSNRRIRIRFTSYSLRQMGGSMPSCSPAFFLYLLHGTFNPFRNELREWADIHVDARAVQRLQIDGTILHQDHSPGIAPRGERGVHEKTGYPSVTVRIGVHITEDQTIEDPALRHSFLSHDRPGRTEMGSLSSGSMPQGTQLCSYPKARLPFPATRPQPQTISPRPLSSSHEQSGLGEG